MSLNEDVIGLYEIVRVPDKPTSIRNIIEDGVDESKAWCVKIKKGKWKGIIYSYGKIDFKKGWNSLKVNIESDILFVPEDKRKELKEEEYKEWETLIGKIAINIIYDNEGNFDLKSGKMFINK